MLLSVKNSLLLFFISYLFFISLLLFTRGFLLSKKILKDKSHCEVAKNCELFHPPKSFECVQTEIFQGKLIGEDICPFSGSKVILLFIDALRYDFAEYIPNGTLPYENKLTVIHELLTKGGQLYKFVADPPTTTLQRLQALMTGTLPTFIDIGSSFASYRVEEDNLISQLVLNHKNVIFMGDDTWLTLFPKGFHRSFPYPSFNVRDLDTVDKGVMTHLIPEMKKPDWDMIIGHFLGVDHCGHRYGPNHPEMTRKLLEMDSVIRKVVADMDNDTLLIVAGDHGMTETGDHGGGGEKEVTAALFAYSLQPLVKLKGPSSVKQIDLTPTLSTLLGVPIPYPNLGKTILGLLPDFRGSFNSNLKYISSVVYSNIAQITKYAQTYSSINSQLSQEKMKDLLDTFDSLTKQYHTLHSVPELDDFLGHSSEFLSRVRQIFEEMWVQFDSFSMSRGLILMFLALALVYIVVDGVPLKHFDEVITPGFLFYSYLGVIVSGMIPYSLHLLSVLNNVEVTVYFFTGTISLLCLSILIIINWNIISNSWYAKSKRTDYLNVFARFFILLCGLGMFSNSYIVEECATVSFLLATIIWVAAMEVKAEESGKKKDKDGPSFLTTIRWKSIFFAVLLSILLRVSWFYWRCREEQTRTCSMGKSLSNTNMCLTTILAFAVFVTLVRYYLRSLGNLMGFSPTVLGSRYIPPISIVCAGCYWVLQSLPSETKQKLIPPTHLNSLPQISFLLSSFCIVLLFILPTSVTYVPRSSGLSLHGGAVAPVIFQQLKDLIRQKSRVDGKGFPIVYGLATAYSAAFINLGVFLTLLGAVLLGETRALVALILFGFIFLLSALISTVRISRSFSKEDIYSVPWWAIHAWTLSSVYFFYGTGHQATFQELHWDPAFIFGEVVSTFVPGILVAANTFISQIIHGLLLPLLYVMPFTLSIVWPKLVPNIQSKKGELTIFENRSLAKKGVVTLTIKYIILSGARVFCSMAAASIHARHLMAWKIFAPKLLFESVGFLVTIGSALFGVLFFERISFSIQKIVNKIEEENS